MTQPNKHLDSFDSFWTMDDLIAKIKKDKREPNTIAYNHGHFTFYLSGLYTIDDLYSLFIAAVNDRGQYKG